MPEHSASVWPLKGGVFNFWTGDRLSTTEDSFPTDSHTATLGIRLVKKKKKSILDDCLLYLLLPGATVR